MTRVYTISEACRILKCCRQTLYKYIKEGEISARKKGKWYVLADSVDKFLTRDEDIINAMFKWR